MRLDTCQRPEEPCEHGHRAEHERHGRRRRELERVDEAHLVQEQREGGDRDLAKLCSAADAQRSLECVRQHEEDRGRQAVAHRRVREGLEAVVQQVLRDDDVERPEDDGEQQHPVCRGQAALHRATLLI